MSAARPPPAAASRRRSSVSSGASSASAGAGRLRASAASAASGTAAAPPRPRADGVSMVRLYAINKQLTDTYVHFARADIEEGRFAQAVVNLTNAIELKADFADAYFERGLAYMLLKDYKAAIKDFEGALKAQPRFENNRIFLLLGLCCKYLGEFAAGTRYLSRGIVADPQFLQAILARAELFMKLKSFEKALVDYTDALRIDPALAVAMCGCARAHESLGDLRKARSLLRRASQLQPDEEEPYFERARLCIELGESDAALSELSALIDLNAAKHAGVCKHETALFFRSRLFMRLGELEHAWNDIELCIRANDRLPESFFQRALLHFRGGDFQRAFSDFEECLKRDPKEHADAHYHETVLWQYEPRAYRELARAAVFLQQRREVEALRVLEGLERESCRLPELFKLLGFAYLALRKFDLSATAYKKYTDADLFGAPIDVRAVVNLHVARANREYERRNVDLSATCFEEALSEYGMISRVFLLMKSRSVPSDIVEQATHVVDQVGAHPVFLPYAYFVSGLAKLHSDRLRESSRDFSVAIEALPDVWAFRFCRALAMSLAGLPSEAAEDFALARSLAQTLHSRAPTKGFAETLCAAMHARSLFSMRRNDQANKVLKPLPSTPEVVCLRGDVLFQAGELDQAMDMYNHVLETLPRHPRALASRARVYACRYKLHEALIDYGLLLENMCVDRGVAFDRDSIRAMQLCKKGDYRKGMVELTKLLSVKTPPPTALFSRTTLLALRGTAQMMIEDDADNSEQYLKDLTQATSLDANDAFTAWITLIVLALRSQQLDEAQMLLNRMNKLRVSTAGALLLESLLVAARGNEAASQEIMVKVLERDSALVDRFMTDTDRTFLIDLSPNAVRSPAVGPHVAGVRVGHRTIQVRPLFCWPFVSAPPLDPALSDSLIGELPLAFIPLECQAHWDRVPDSFDARFAHRADDVPSDPFVAADDGDDGNAEADAGTGADAVRAPHNGSAATHEAPASPPAATRPSWPSSVPSTAAPAAAEAGPWTTDTDVEVSQLDGPPMAPSHARDSARSSMPTSSRRSSAAAAAAAAATTAASASRNSSRPSRAASSGYSTDGFLSDDRYSSDGFLSDHGTPDTLATPPPALLRPTAATAPVAAERPQALTVAAQLRAHAGTEAAGPQRPATQRASSVDEANRFLGDDDFAEGAGASAGGDFDDL